MSTIAVATDSACGLSQQEANEYGFYILPMVFYVGGEESKNGELDYMVNLCAYMRKRGKLAQAENIMKRILSKFSKDQSEVEKMVKAKEMEL